MKIFIAGATGTLGRPVSFGDALDARGMKVAVAAARPDQVIHLLTALPPGGPLRKRQLAPTNQLRTEGTANLIEASVEAGAHRLVAESFVGIYGPAVFDRPASEDEAARMICSGVNAETIAALRSLESQLQRERESDRLTTVALRIGFLYGYDVPAMRELVRQARAGRLFLPRDFGGVAPFVHVDDAARAIVAAVEHPCPSAVYNVVDDAPIALITFAAKLAAAIGAPPVRHVPRWLLKLAAPVMADFGSAVLRLSNEKIKRELAWSPRYPSVEAGLSELRRLAKEVA